ncbi:MAG: hypothetical protein U5N26_04500 [Candidatus Marinimicrobia bacterium]|nr:hypothetical protein [Candidatus Neomarinimicrobiota bacterium]
MERAILFPSEVFPHARRAHQAESGTFRILLELEDGEEFQNAVLHILEPVMVFVKDRRRPADVEVVLGEHAPRKLQHPVDIGFADGIFRGEGGHHGKAFDLLFHGVPGFFGKPDLFQFLMNVVDLGIVVLRFPEFFFNGLQLFAEEEFTLLTVDLLTHVVVDPGIELNDLVFFLQGLYQMLQTLQDIQFP